MSIKTAIIHYRWLSNRGGEAVIASLVEIFPDADLYIHVCDEPLVRALRRVLEQGDAEPEPR